MRTCGACGGRLEDGFRFCPHCGVAQRTKIVEYFRGHPDLDDGGLRASVYLTAPCHVRLSIWRGDRAEAALSLDPGETHRLGRFLLSVAPRRHLDALARLRRGVARSRP